MGLKDDLKSMAERLGVDLFGVVRAEDLNDAPKGHRPRDLVPDARSVIVFGMKLLDAQVDLHNGNVYHSWELSCSQAEVI